MLDGDDVLTFPHSDQDPGSTVREELQLLGGFAGDPDEQCVAGAQSGGHKS